MLLWCILVYLNLFIKENLKWWQRGRLEEQVRQHNKKGATAVSEVASAEEEAKKSNDDSYEVTLDEDFLTALEYGMPPASGMVRVYNIFINVILGMSLAKIKTI